MAAKSRGKRSLGQVLAGQLKRGLVVTPGQACLMFINQVDPEVIPAEVEASPPDFRRALAEYVASLNIGGPGWDECFLSGGIYYFGDRRPDEAAALDKSIARKNRVTAELLLRYFQSRQEAEPER